MFIVGIMIVRRVVQADQMYITIACRHDALYSILLTRRITLFPPPLPQSPPSATPPAPLPLPTPPESRALETFDMIAALLSMCVHKQYFYMHEMLSCFSKTHAMISLNCYTIYYSAPLLHMYRCWCSSHRGTDPPES